MEKITLIYSNHNRLGLSKLIGGIDVNTHFWLNSLLQQTNKNFRVVIVDSQSSNEETIKDIVCEFIDNGIECKVIFIRQMDVFNKPLHLNTGALYAKEKYKSKYFCFSDVDMVYANNFIDKYFEYVSTTTQPNRIFGPNMVSIKGFNKTYPPKMDIKDKSAFDFVMSCEPTFKYWKNVPGGCQCCLSDTFFAVNGYNSKVKFNCEDTHFRKKCEGIFGKQQKIQSDNQLVLHLPHEKNDYVTKTVECVNKELRDNNFDNTYEFEVCPIIDEFESEC